MKKFRITFQLKNYLKYHLMPIETAEIEAATILEAMAILLTKNEYLDIQEIRKIELMEGGDQFPS